MTAPHIAARHRGFTLVETLVVMSIVIMLFAAAAAGAKKSWGSQELRASAIRLSHDLALASQTSVKLNQPVQVRFYKHEGGDVANATGEPQFLSYQMVVRDPVTGIARALVERQSFEGPTLLSGFARFSSVVSKTEKRDQEKDPELGIGDYEYASVEFRPNGRTNLDPSAEQPWTLTLIPPAWVDRVGEVPPDFQTLSIEPLTGAVRMW